MEQVFEEPMFELFECLFDEDKLTAWASIPFFLFVVGNFYLDLCKFTQELNATFWAFVLLVHL
jgi:hypothetical protein